MANLKLSLTRWGVLKIMIKAEDRLNIKFIKFIIYSKFTGEDSGIKLREEVYFIHV